MTVVAALVVVLAVLALSCSAALAATNANCEKALSYVRPTIGTTGLGYAGGQGSPAAQGMCALLVSLV